MIIFHWFQSLYWPETGKGYALGSSWAGDTGTLSIFGIFYITWKRHNCHGKRCLRVARHVRVVDGHHEMYCRKHLPKRSGDDEK